AALNPARELSVRIKLVPRKDNVSPDGKPTSQACVVMKGVMSLHHHCFAHTGADEVVSVTAAAAQFEIGKGCIDDSGEGGVAAEFQGGVAFQTIVNEGY